MAADPRNVELLYFAGCPNLAPTRSLVEAVADETRVPVRIELHEVGLDEVEAVRFLGSPSLRVDGHDVEPGADHRQTFMYACRVYRTERGLSGQPAREWVRSALLTTS